MQDAKGFVTTHAASEPNEDGWTRSDKPIDNPLKDKQLSIR